MHKFSELERACIEFYYHNDNAEIVKEELLNLLNLAFSSNNLDNYNEFERSDLLWLHKHLQKLLTAIYKMPIDKRLHISNLREIALKQSN